MQSPTVLTQNGFVVAPGGETVPRMEEANVPLRTLVTHRACFIVASDGDTELMLVERSRYPM
jgi:hypothetical protein